MCSPFVEKFGIPRQSNLVNTTSYIQLIAPYDDINAFQGIEQFSHLWLLWQFHANDIKKNDNAVDKAKTFQPMIRPPRLGGNQKIGVFASRSMYRPSQIGLSVVQFLEVKKVENELRLYVQGADILSGTPIVDIKPYLAYADAIPDAMSGYAPDAPKGRRNVQDLQLPTLHPGCSNPLGCTGDLYRWRHRLNLERIRLPDGLVELA